MTAACWRFYFERVVVGGLPCDFQRGGSRCRRDPNRLTEISEETRHRNPDVNYGDGKKRGENDERRGLAELPEALTHGQTGVKLATPTQRSTSAAREGGGFHFP